MEGEIGGFFYYKFFILKYVFLFNSHDVISLDGILDGIEHNNI